MYKALLDSTVKQIKHMNQIRSKYINDYKNVVLSALCSDRS